MPFSTMPSVISELLFSKVAHDLASPVGATENGLELLAEEDGSMAEDALALVRQSAHSVASRLRYFRLCYGTVGGSKSLSPDTVKHTVMEFYRYEQRLRISFGETAMLGEHHTKLLFNLIPCASDALPYGGTLAISWQEQQITIEAVSARPEKGIKRGTLMPWHEGAPIPDDLSAYTVHSWYTGYYAASCAATVSMDEQEPATLVIRAAFG